MALVVGHHLASAARFNAASKDLDRVATQNVALLKTQMCKFYLKRRCNRGTGCTWAHSAGELAPRPDFFKTQLCPALFLPGGCTAGSECRHAHSHAELRRTSRSLGSTEQLEEAITTLLQATSSPVPMATYRGTHGLYMATYMRHQAQQQQWQHQQRQQLVRPDDGALDAECFGAYGRSAVVRDTGMEDAMRDSSVMEFLDDDHAFARAVSGGSQGPTVRVWEDRGIHNGFLSNAIEEEDWTVDMLPATEVTQGLDVFPAVQLMPSELVVSNTFLSLRSYPDHAWARSDSSP